MTGDSLVLRARPAYYDMLDSGPGQIPNAALSMADLELAIGHGRLHVSRFTLVDVESVNPGLSGLSGDRGAAWRLRLGVEQERLGCGDCLVARAQGDLGLGRQWLAFFGAVYVGGALQSDRLGDGFGYARAATDVVIKAGDRLGLRLSYERRFPAGGRSASYGVTNVETRWSPVSQVDLRLSYADDGTQMFRLGLGHYW